MGAKILKIYEMCKKVLLFCYFQFMGKWLTSSGKQSTFLGSKKPDPEAILRNSTFRRQGAEADFSRSSLGVLSVELGKV